MNRQNRYAAIVLTTVALLAGGFMWWASSTTPSGPVTSPAPATAASATGAPATGTESAAPAPAPTDTLQTPTSATLLVGDEPDTTTQTGTAEDVAARFTVAYLTRDRDHETWASNWAFSAGSLAGLSLQRNLTQEWAQLQSRTTGSTSTAQVTTVEPLTGATDTDTQRSVIVTATQEETVAGIDKPLQTTVVLHLQLTRTDTGWVVDTILPQAD